VPPEPAAPEITAEEPGIDLPSMAEGFGSLDEVSEAVVADRRRLAAFEARLADMERRDPPTEESLPAAGSGSPPPDEARVTPELTDTVALRQARLRVEGRMYELYDWACAYDFVNQINVNNAVYPTKRDSGPLPAVTDLWLQVREVPLLGIVRVGNQQNPTATSTSPATAGSPS